MLHEETESREMTNLPVPAEAESVVLLPARVLRGVVVAIALADATILEVGNMMSNIEKCNNNG
jgi:hypothetical protein